MSNRAGEVCALSVQLVGVALNDHRLVLSLGLRNQLPQRFVELSRLIHSSNHHLRRAGVGGRETDIPKVQYPPEKTLLQADVPNAEERNVLDFLGEDSRLDLNAISVHPVESVQYLQLHIHDREEHRENADE